MHKAILVSLALYSIATLTSMAGMELFGWLSALFALLVILKQCGEKSYLEEIRLGPDKALLLLLVVTLIGAALNAESSKEFFDMSGRQRWILLSYLLFVALREVLNVERLKKWLPVIVTIAGILAIYAFSQFFTGKDLIRGADRVLHVAVAHPETNEPLRWRSTGPFGSPMTFGYSFGLIFSVCFALCFWAVKEKSKNLLIPLAVATPFLFLSLVTSFQRGVWMGLTAAIFVMLFLMIRSRKKYFILVSAMGLLGIVFMFNESLSNRLMAAFDPSKASVSDRLYLWKANWLMFTENPIFGVGYGRNEDIAREFLARVGAPDGFSGHAHNTYLQYLSGTGILGFISFMWFVLYFLVKSVKTYFAKLSQDSFVAHLAVGIFGAQVFLMVGGLTECNFKDAEVNHQFMLWLVLLAFLYPKRKHAASESVTGT